MTMTVVVVVVVEIFTFFDKLAAAVMSFPT